jgi:hypothetical protein
MPRQPLPVGAHGKISPKQLGPKLWQARCKYRDLNGEIQRPSARGATKSAAVNALPKKLTRMTTTAASGAELVGDDRFKKAADM